MTDPITTGATILAGAKLVSDAKLVEKLLGPTADYIGEGIKSWTQRRVDNLNRIFAKAISKSGSKLDTDGGVPPRVLKGVLDEGSFCEDELSAEYFGGVLASSRTSTSRDDRGAAFLALISRLSTYQIRAHYICYSVIRSEFCGAEFQHFHGEDRSKMMMFIPYTTFVPAMDFSDQELDQGLGLLEHVCFGLSREELIAKFVYGPKEPLETVYGFAVDSPGIVFEPTVLGAEFYLWAHGLGGMPARALLDPGQALSTEGQISIPPGCKRASSRLGTIDSPLGAAVDDSSESTR